jgi:hypothetical protein
MLVFILEALCLLLSVGGDVYIEFYTFNVMLTASCQVLLN